ncbi:MAG: RecB-family nuclease [Sulfolobales archaeon]|nr:RecB-family nuclease [Sulfolobales archaeon]MDW8082861.1 RecB-family nuclease [Sulfolobales archaeon]
MITVVLSGVTSPHRLVESVKVAYGFRGASVDMFIVTKTTGLASQVGIPEAYKVALKYGKPLVVLSSLKDVFEYFRFSEVYIVLPGQSGLRKLEDLEIGGSKYAFIFIGEEYSRSEAPIEALSIPELPVDSPPQVTIALTLYTISSKMKSLSSESGGR